MKQRITNREAIAQVKGLFRESNADSTLTNKQAYSLIKKHSFWIIKRESERLKFLRMDSLFQPWSCQEVVLAPVGDNCCALKGILNCNIYRTKNKLPEAYEDLRGPIIREVTSLDRSTKIVINSPQQIQRLLTNRYAKKYLGKDKTIRAYYSDGYFYFPENYIKIIRIEALFMSELVPDKNDDCSPCKDCEETSKCKKFLDRDFMVSDYLWAQIIDAVKNDLGVREQMPDKSHTIDKNDNK